MLLSCVTLTAAQASCRNTVWHICGPAVHDMGSAARAECADAAAANLVDNLTVPDPDKSKPAPMKTSCYRRRANPVVEFLYKACQEEVELSILPPEPSTKQRD